MKQQIEGTEFTRHVSFYPGHCKRPEKPGDSDYGIKAMKAVFTLSGPKGAVSFLLDLGLYPIAALKDLAGNQLALEYEATRMSEKVDVPIGGCRRIVEHQRRGNVEDSERFGRQKCEVNASGIGFHYKENFNGGDAGAHEKNCEFTGGKCWYSETGLAAQGVFLRFINEGEDGLWDDLEKRYTDTFQPEN